MTVTTKPLVRVSGAVKYYGEVPALAGVDLEVFPGEAVGILGANGAGKTTLIESIMGARFLDEGDIEVCGLSPVMQREECVKRMSLQPQGSSLFRHLSVAESLELWAAFYPQPRAVNEVLTLVGLEQKRRARIKTLSGGQQQRVRLALALIGDTEIVAFDEPTVGLDPLAREQVWDVIRQRAGRGAVVMATQMMDEAEALCDRVVMMDSGRVVAVGGIGDLMGRYAGQGSVSFKVSGAVHAATMENLPGVLWASTRRVGSSTSVRLVTQDLALTQTAVRASGSVKAERIKTVGPSLGDVFLRLVGKEINNPTPEEN
ncbi:ABC transporter ATP-binding protein [Arachnia propionica]|uniref:ABC transporter ATP-binding protein n=1 Tax=Arachnia propionica TaxID=1750 RepID=A0A3P1WM43_9ACTN|nr:ABC transporter ATP-binding protein [Arachnia propionica]RRD47614.1 ABC transporter ATP-binding protein [Arachnia propionica]